MKGATGATMAPGLGLDVGTVMVLPAGAAAEEEAALAAALVEVPVDAVWALGSGSVVGDFLLLPPLPLPLPLLLAFPALPLW